MILKCQAVMVVLQTASALFSLFTQLHRGKSSGSHNGRAAFPGRAGFYFPQQASMEPEEVGDAPKDALFLLLDGQTLARYRAPEYPQGTTMCPKISQPSSR